MKEKQQDYTLMKARSYRRVITTGLRLYTSSFRKVFRATWPFTLALILIAAVCGAIVTTRLLPVALQILALPAYKWLIVQEHWMMIAATVLLSVTGLAVFVLIGLKTGRRLDMFHTIKGLCKAAVRHWLLTLGILLAGAVILIPVCLFVSLPVVILTTASIQAQAGTLMGDPLGMPSYITWLAGGTWLLAAFLQVYILMSLLPIGYFAYGSAETRKQEQQKLSIK